VTPSCAINFASCTVPQCSATRPLGVSRTQSMSRTSTLLPVAGMPNSSPLCVPVSRTRQTAWLPLPMTDSTWYRASGSPACDIWTHSATRLMPVAVEPGSSSCSMNAGAKTVVSSSVAPRSKML